MNTSAAINFNQGSLFEVIENRIAHPVVNYSNLSVKNDEYNNAIFCEINEHAPAYFSNQMLADLKETMNQVTSRESIKYLIIASKIPGIFSLGGDLQLFRKYIEQGNKAALKEYGTKAVDLVYALVSSHQRGIQSVALVEGKAYGGGFEAVLASDVIIASEDAHFSFPEIIFNLFPGMGAYTLLRRRVSSAQARHLISSGKTYPATAMHEMGIIDYLTKPGRAREFLYDYMFRNKNRFNGLTAIQRAIDIREPVSFDELTQVVNIWVEAALALTDRDLRKMELLIRSQKKMLAG